MAKVVIELTTKQSQFDALIKEKRHVFYGGAKGGGKSHGLREIMLKRRIETAGSYGVIFRKTYPELYNNHIRPLLAKFPALQSRYNSKHNEIHFENGSILAFRHCQYDKDLLTHQGQEYHDLAIEEAGEWSEDWFWTLKGSNRSGTPGIKPKCLLTGNPGGIGHKWLKRLFIEKVYRQSENPDEYGFVQAKVWDNPALMENDPGYIDTLRANKNPMMVKAYLDGSWDIMAGQFFDMVSRETHVVKQFEIPDHWFRFCMFDTGYNHPAAMVWVAVDTDGQCYVYRELVKAKRRSEEFAQEAMVFPDMAAGKVSRNVPAGWDCWTKHGGGPSVEEKFYQTSKGAMVFVKANIDRVAGAQQLRDYLVIRDNGKPRLQFMDNCPITYECISRMVHDPSNPEDVLKVDADEGDVNTGDDPYDCVRYGMMSRPRIGTTPPPVRRKYYDGKDYEATSWTTV